jgi:hypothetical protein
MKISNLLNKPYKLYVFHKNLKINKIYFINSKILNIITLLNKYIFENIKTIFHKNILVLVLGFREKKKNLPFLLS